MCKTQKKSPYINLFSPLCFHPGYTLAKNSNVFQLPGEQVILTLHQYSSQICKPISIFRDLEFYVLFFLYGISTDMFWLWSITYDSSSLAHQNKTILMQNIILCQPWEDDSFFEVCQSYRQINNHDTTTGRQSDLKGILTYRTQLWFPLGPRYPHHFFLTLRVFHPLKTTFQVIFTSALAQRQIIMH